MKYSRHSGRKPTKMVGRLYIIPTKAMMLRFISACSIIVRYEAISQVTKIYFDAVLEITYTTFK